MANQESNATYMEPRVCGVRGEVPGFVFKLKVGSRCVDQCGDGTGNQACTPRVAKLGIFFTVKGITFTVKH
jgi:hypothetical protein